MRLLTLSRVAKFAILLTFLALLLIPGAIAAQSRMFDTAPMNSQPTATEPGSGTLELPAEAIRVIDGSSLEAWVDTGRVAIGIIGIEAPGGNTACGRQATQVLQHMLHGTIRFEEDLDLPFDEQQRRMYHAFLEDGSSIAERLVERGYAYANGDGDSAAELADLEQQARDGEQGCLWNPRYPFDEHEPAADDLHGHTDEPAFGLMATDMPDGFEADVVVGGLNYPTSFAFLPDGGILVGENSGIVRLYRNGSLSPTPFIDIRSEVNDYWDRGLISIAVDPEFDTNGYVYLYFTYENDPSDYTGRKTARLIRVTADGDTASLDSQEILLGTVSGRTCNDFPAGADCLPSDGPSHSAGDIQFASDGTIFVTSGDGAEFNTVVDDAVRAQDLDLLAGKILRITRSGEGVAGNPFWNGDPQANRSKVWGLGLRNAFRFDLQPGTNTPYLGDVGWNEVEEINVAVPGANMGWPCYEGAGQNPGFASYSACQDLYDQGPSAHHGPLIEWPHAGGGAAAAGGVFYTGTNYPPEYRGAYFYADYVQSWIRYVHVDGSHNIVSGPHDFATGADGPVNFEMGPDGNIYYLAINTGEIRRIRHIDGSGGPPPPAGEVVYLSDLEWISATNGWGPVERDMSNGEELPGDGSPISIGGVTYDKGLGVHALSEIRYNLGEACHTFVTDIGIDDESGDLGSVAFEVWVDDAQEFESAVRTGSDPAQTVQVDVEGGSELRLIVGDGGDGIDYDHANWADARLLCDEDGGAEPPPPTGELVYLSDIDWVSATNGWGPVERDTSNGEELAGDGGPITIDGVTYDKGLGVHAVSEITYHLGGACHSFISDIGVDDEVDGPGSVTFEVWLDGELAFASDVLTASDPADSVHISVDGADELRLIVGDGGDGVNHDHANWADAHLLCDEGGDNPEAPSVSITSPSASDLFQVGDEVIFSGEATNSAGEALPDSALRWRIIIHHCSESDCHMHQFLQPEGVAGGSFEVPDHGDIFYFEFRLTAEGANGLTSTDVVEFHPQTVDITLDTEPAGLDVTLGGVSGPAPVSRTVVVNSLNTITTPSAQQGLVFDSWAHGGERQQNVLAGEDNASYVARFTTPDDPPPADEVLYLSDIDWISATNGWGPVERDMSNGEEFPGDGGPITIGGVIYEKGLGVHAISELIVDVPAACHTFVSDIGVDAETGDLGTVTFEVWVDGTQEFASGIMTGTDAAETLQVSVAGAGELRLFVDDAGDGIDFDHANWADARFLCDGDGDGGDPPPPPPPPPDEVVYLSDLEWVSATNGWGPVERDMSNGEEESGDGGPISIGGVTYEKGLGVHAESEVVFNLNGACHTFISDIGIDDETGDLGSVTFEVRVDGVQAFASGVLTGTDSAESVEVSVEGASELRLVVGDGGDGDNHDHANWAGARLLCGDDDGGGDPPPPPERLLGDPTYFPAGTHAHSVYPDDLNGDGIIDLVVANAGSNSVSLLFGTGGGSFSAPTDHAVGAEPKSAITSDLNGNGMRDIVTANQNSNTVSVLLATGGGNFAPAVDHAVCVGAHEVKAGDFNGNGTQDLAVACWGGSVISVLLGNGDGTFQESISYDVGSNPHALVARDFNGDGALDLAIANHGSANISVLLGNGDGTFQSATTYASGAGPHSIDSGDLNGNGVIDLVVANDGSDSVSVFLGNGDGTFQSHVEYEVDHMPKGVRLGDLNGDGVLDIVSANTFNNYESSELVDTTISVLLGNGDGTFQPAESYGVNTTPFAVALADFTGNGRLDVATANWHSGDVAILLNE